ncbi:replication associated protein [Peromfec virus RodF8_96]|uniref:Replication associated protein n=1 Tax=Peromfec virus RodF8_96 TaxID=2929260 RepID=A0A976N284_9VIRU|nr:replication associated protein [Peromfec virus RodF8_96]
MEQAHGTGTPGNTIARCSKRRAYIITFWIKDYPKELPSKTKYLATCEDTTKDGKYHGHAFIYFNNPVSMKAVKKLFGNNCHVEKPISNNDSINYVLNKDSRKHNFQEFGKRPMDNCVHNISELMLLDRDDVQPNYYNTWKKIHDEESNNIEIDDWHKDVDVYYIYGPSGIGKTEKAKDIVRDYSCILGNKINQVKYENGFWIGIGNEPIAIYDDFRDSHMKPSEFINFIDYNKHTMNIKLGSRVNNYKLIIITSVQHPEYIYSNVDDEPRKQWLRRMTILELNY